MMQTYQRAPLELVVPSSAAPPQTPPPPAPLVATDQAEPRRLADLFPLYERYQLDRKKRQPRGVERYMQALRWCSAALGPDATTADLTPARLDTYLGDIGARLAANTTLLALTALRSFCRWAVKHQLLTTDPTRDLEAPKKHRPAPKPLSRQQLRDLFRTIAAPEHAHGSSRARWARNRRAIYLMLFAGLRLAEVTALHWRDVDLDASTLMVRNGKGGKDRAIPLHPGLVAELRICTACHPDQAVAGRIDGVAYTDPQSLAHLFEHWLPRRAAALSLTLRISAHQLRHTFATEMLRHGADLASIQGLLGHASLETTQCYLQVDASQHRAAVDVLPARW